MGEKLRAALSLVWPVACSGQKKTISLSRLPQPIRPFESGIFFKILIIKTLTQKITQKR